QEWLWANSLGLAFFGMFIAAFVLHGLFGTWKYNEHQMLLHLPKISWAAYLVTLSFWSSVFETWEAEFAVIGIYVVLSIFLRQERSPESKRLGAETATPTNDPTDRRAAAGPKQSSAPGRHCDSAMDRTLARVHTRAARVAGDAPIPRRAWIERGERQRGPTGWRTLLILPLLPPPHSR
ncbi:MAG: DUF6766 family protein, partial [Rhodanobacteraceae bacterium]